MSANLENSAMATELEKVSFHSNPKESNGKDLTEAEERGGKNTQMNCTQKLLMIQITTMVWSLT